jgi:mannan endo-1,4-beta-mannosidase
MQQRGMTAVLMLSNNWEWSGGFLQYLNWNNLLTDSLLIRKMEWDDMRDHISRFYSCSSCISQYQEQVKRIITRVNTITGKKYTEDPAILSWEIANEPRPMRPAAITEYMQFIHASAMLIRSLDSNHLITTGSEGYIGSETMAVYKTVHQDKYIDYITIHIWPKNWGWFSDKKMADQFNQILRKTRAYVRKHRAEAMDLKKPLVIEEFGLPRDGQSFSLTSATTFRDRYYSFLFSMLSRDAKKGGPVAGAVFWAFGGMGRPSGKNNMWQAGDDWLGDPPMEEQGLNTVFDQDKTTWLLIFSVTAMLSGLTK